MATCKLCGKEIGTGYMDSEQMLEEQLCFDCFFWKQHYEDDKKRPAHTWAVIDGNHYLLESHTKDSAWAGCGGVMRKIKFYDGTIVECDNLWHQGRISDEWIEKFPNNAEFLTF